MKRYKKEKENRLGVNRYAEIEIRANEIEIMKS